MKQIIISDKYGERFCDRKKDFLSEGDETDYLIIFFLVMILLPSGVFAFTVYDDPEVGNLAMAFFIAITILASIYCVYCKYCENKNHKKFRQLGDELMSFSDKLSFTSYKIKVTETDNTEKEYNFTLVDGSSYWREPGKFLCYNFGYRLTIPGYPDYCFILYPHILDNVKEVISMEKSN